MIDIRKAEELVLEYLRDMENSSKIELGIMKDETISFQFGWMFFYQSKRFIEKGNLLEMIGGNAPIIVDKINGSIHLTGTRMGEEYYIDNYCRYRDDINGFYKEINS